MKELTVTKTECVNVTRMLISKLSFSSLTSISIPVLLAYHFLSM